MEYEVIWSATARANLIAIRTYLEALNPYAAERLAGALVAAAESLNQLPHRGRPVAPGQRELVSVWPYLIRYRVSGDRVFILRIRHGARRPV